MFNDKELMHDPIFLAGKVEVSTKEDLPIVQDLLDTLMAHKDSCVGMATNMMASRNALSLFSTRVDELLHTLLCSSPRLLKKTVRITPRRDDCLFSVIRVRVNAINLSR